VYAPLQPNLVDGVQKGWFTSDSTFNVAVIDQPREIGDYAYIAFILGFHPVPDGDASTGFLEKLVDVLSQMPSKSKLCLSHVNSNSATMTIKADEVLTEQDVRMVTEFNEKVFAVRYREMPRQEYHHMFLTHGFVVFGT
jgi:hypothetical protein